MPYLYDWYFKELVGGFIELREYTPVTGPQDIWAELGLPNEDAKLRQQVTNGLPVEVFYMVASWMGVAQVTIREALHIPSSTFLRRKKAGRFTMKESDRLYSLIDVMARANELFNNDRGAAVEWMTKEVPGLGHKRPIDMLDSHVNTQAILDLMIRLQFGVYS